MKKSFVLFTVFSLVLVFGCKVAVQPEEPEKQEPLEISATVSTEELTKQDVMITVTAEGNDISKVVYVYGPKTIGNAEQILNDQSAVTLTAGADGKYTVIAAQNGVYSIAAVNKSGTTAFVEKVISNIDKTVPPSVTSVTLNRYHISETDENRNIDVTAYVSNLENLKEGTPVKIQVTDAQNTTDYEATVNKTAGTVSATINVPTANNNGNEGTDYTVRIKIGDEVDTVHTARFNVCSSPSLNNVYLKETQNGTSADSLYMTINSVTSDSKFYISIDGYNLDLLTTLSVQLYDSTETACYTTPVTVNTDEIQWTGTTGNYSNTLTAELSVPQIDDAYKVTVLFDGNAKINIPYIRTLYVYGVPKFTEFSIPKADISKEYNSVTATIKGKHFTAPTADTGNFSVICSSNPSIVTNSSFTVVSDSIMTVTLTIPGTVGDYPVTVKYGANTKNGIFNVKDYSGYSAGDVLLNDGTVIGAADIDTYFTTDARKESAVGVINLNQYGVPVILGKYNSYGNTDTKLYQWAQYGAIGYNNNLTGIQGTKTSGDMDGSDNWDYICSIDPDRTEDAETYYPAFNYVNNYAETYNLTGEYAAGWYMPSVAELYTIYQNDIVINSSLQKIGGTQMYSAYYWSSSQVNYGSYDFAWYVNFGNGVVDYGLKGSNRYVCAVRAF